MAEPEGVWEVCPPHEPKLFHFHGNFRKNWSNCTNRTPQLIWTPRSKTPGSVPVRIWHGSNNLLPCWAPGNYLILLGISQWSYLVRHQPIILPCWAPANYLTLLGTSQLSYLVGHQPIFITALLSGSISNYSKVKVIYPNSSNLLLQFHIFFFHLCVRFWIGTRCLIFDQTLRLLPYFMCANSEGSGNKDHNLNSWLKSWYFYYRIMGYFRVAKFSRFCIKNMRIILRGF